LFKYKITKKKNKKGNYGKKKIDSVNKSRWKPDFVAWNDSTNINAEHASRVLKRSVYQNDFCRNDPSVNSNLSLFSQASSSTTSNHTNNTTTTTTTNTLGNKLLVARESRPLSVYALNYAHNEPTSETSRETQKETYYRFIAKNMQRSKSCVGNEQQRRHNNNSQQQQQQQERSSVANCLVWHDRISSAQSQQQQQTNRTNEQSLPPPPPPPTAPASTTTTTTQP
jgi:hypothetical protein